LTDEPSNGIGEEQDNYGAECHPEGQVCRNPLFGSGSAGLGRWNRSTRSSVPRPARDRDEMRLAVQHTVALGTARG
jgi:hypothetical protein